VVIICIGVLTMALAHRWSQADWRTIGFALLDAVVIATYTLQLVVIALADISTGSRTRTLLDRGW
jgi:hypothetical protein